MSDETKSFEIPEVSFPVTKSILAALKHATHKDGKLASLTFLVRDEYIFIGATNGRVAVIIRTGNESEAENCGFSGNFEAASALETGDSQVLKIETVAHKELLPMPYANIIGENGVLRVAIDQPLGAFLELMRINIPEVDRGVALPLERLDALIKTAKAYDKAARLEMLGDTRNNRVIVRIQGDDSFFGVVASPTSPSGLLPGWATGGFDDGL